MINDNAPPTEQSSFCAALGRCVFPLWTPLPLLGAVSLLVLVAAGCQDSPAGPPPAVTPPTAAPTTATAQAAPAPQAASAPAAKPTPPTPQKTEQPKLDAAKLLEKAGKQIEQGQLDEAQQVLAQLRGAQPQLAKSEVDRLNELESARDEKRRAQVAEARAKSLTQAAELLEQGKLEAATLALDEVAKAFPTDAERKTAAQLKSKIEEHRRRRREFGIAMKLLASPKKEEVRSARLRFAEDPEVAIPLLIETLQGTNPTLAKNALESLRLLNEPARTLPALVGVLANDSQTALWPAAVTEIQKIAAPGAGEPLLKLAISSKAGPQRVAALTALGGVVDPPPQTLIELLPQIYQDGPDLPAVLAAVQQSIVMHGQFDLLARRGLDGELTPEQEQQLAGLAARLTALSAEGPAPGSKQQAAQAAQTLGVLTRLLVPHPLTDVKVLRATAELPESPAAAVLDGVWNSVELKTMWRHPVEKDKRITLVLDLGTERTVAALRIWNENEVGGRHRGWKDVDVFVSNTTASLKPVARGIVPQAPGAADAADYGCLLNIPCVRGRFIRLECSSQWAPDGIGGISEVQVLGF